MLFRSLRQRGAHIVIDDPDTLPDLIEAFAERMALEANSEEEG